MQAKPAPLSPDEYLDREARSPTKSEYVDGEVYAMSGATRRHNLIAGNLFFHAKRAALARRQCQVFASDMKLRVETVNCFYYPDLSVCCDPDDCHELYLTRPCFIVEVAAPSTAGIDRREKRRSYASLPSLREYAIVDQDRLRVEVYRREGSGWQGYVLSQPSDTLDSSCLALHLTLQEIYEGVEFPAGVADDEAPQYADEFAGA